VGPGFSAFKVVVIGVEADEIDCEFAPGNELIEKSIFVGFRGFGFLLGQPQQ
jgi:hypothetical protein